MSRSSHEASSANSTRRRGRSAAAALTTGALAALIALVASAGAATTAHTTIVLGQTGNPPNPSCPGLPCQAVGSVTGFQIDNGQLRLPFNVPREGKITAWTLTLAQPTPKQRSFFNTFFGTPPEARLAILRRVPRTNPPRYSLQRQGAVKVLSPYLGQTVKFGASLPVERGDIVGLTVPTWAPGLRPGPARQQCLAGQSRLREVHQLNRRPPGPTANQGRQTGHLRLSLQHRAPALHRHPHRGRLTPAHAPWPHPGRGGTSCTFSPASHRRKPETWLEKVKWNPYRDGA